LPTLPTVNGTKDMSLAPAGSDPALLMIERFAADPNFDVTKMQALMDMREREMRRIAENHFNDAMNAAQKRMRPIATDAENPQTKSNYASYKQLDLAIRPIYTDEGFGISFDSEDSPKGPAWIRVLAYVTNAGHSRTYRIDMPADGKGAKGGDVMTLTHAAGAAMSYGMRYLLKMIFNIAVGEEDRDGNQVRPEVSAPTGFEDWFLDMDASLATATWAKWSTDWNNSKPEFRAHLAKTNTAKINEWKRKAKENGVK
jgi:hypothetical protein